MKTMRKLIALLLVAMMTLGMMTVAFAADGDPVELKDYYISISAGEDTGNVAGSTDPAYDAHEYTVYQIFTGDLAIVEGEKVLSNIKYGSAGVGTVGTKVDKTVLEGIEEADAYVKTLTISALTSCGTLNATNNWTLDDLDAGYYLVVDKTGKKLEEGDTYSQYIVKVLGNVEMNPKSVKVPSDKKTYLANGGTATQSNVSELGVGDVVPFEISATIAENADKYDYYDFNMVDKMSEGLTFNNDIVVTIGGNAAEKGKDYNVFTGDTANGNTFIIALIDAKSHAGEAVKATYSATLNDAAKITEPEKNEYRVVYSNDPKQEYGGDDHEPGKPVSEDSDVHGKGPWHETYHFSTKVKVIKTDDNKVTPKTLEGATFELVSTDATQAVLENGTYYELSETGTYYLLKDGTYTTTVPSKAGYEKIGVGDENTTEGYLYNAETGEYYVPSNKADYNGKDVYKEVAGTEDKYVSTTNKYAQKTATATKGEDAHVKYTLTTGADGTLTFPNLGAGTYTLTETVAPEGFNLADPITFRVVFHVDDTDPTASYLQIEDAEGNPDERFNKENATAIYDVTVIDEPGSVLPETGGIGTTLFYIIGGILVVGAGVLLVTKKRMSARG